MPSLKGDWLFAIANQTSRLCHNCKPHDVISRAREVYGVDVSYKQAHTALTRVRESGLQSGVNSYEALVPWLKEIAEANPGSTHASRTKDGKLESVFIALSAWLQGAEFCLPVISLDACHLKSSVGGTLFCATMLSPNHDIFVIALGISPIENGQAWSWFLAHLRSSSALLQRSDIVIMSDREKGLATSVAEILPGVPHSFCSYHIKKNVKTQFKTDLGGRIHKLAGTVEKAVATSCLEECKRENPAASKYLTDIAPECWRASEFPRPRFGQVTSNIAESSNSWILPERSLTWLECLTTIVRKIQRRAFDKRHEYGSIASDYVPWVIARVAKATEGARRRLVCPVDDTTYVVMRESDRSFAVVDLQRRHCSCRLWQELQYPYYRGCAAILFRKESPLQYVSHYYKISSLVNVFKPAAIPVDVDLLHRDGTLPPQIEKKRGRPKKVRIRSRSEYLNNDSPVHCSQCGISGHNKRTCSRLQKQLRKARDSVV